MLRFPRAGSYRWRKPLVRVESRALPAELVVLGRELRASERGVWVNSRSKASGVVDLVPVPSGKGTFRTRREPLPLFVGRTAPLYRGRIRAWRRDCHCRMELS